MSVASLSLRTMLRGILRNEPACRSMNRRCATFRMSPAVDPLHHVTTYACSVATSTLRCILRDTCDILSLQQASFRAESLC